MIYKLRLLLLAFILSISFLPSTSTSKTAWLFDGNQVIHAKIVDDPISRARGLMYQIWLPPNTGMLFLFDPPAPVTFWMKNTLLPLDMRFYDRFGKPLAHYPAAMPCTKSPCSLYPAMGKVAYVLETRATFSMVRKEIAPLQFILVD